MNLFGGWKEKFLLEGMMPERALLRLRRAGIFVYNAKKIEKNQILFYVKKKDSEKVFAIYPNLCYNKTVYSAYTVKKLGATGAGKYIEFFKRRVGILLGGLFCMVAALAAEPYVFSVDFAGTSVYAREVLIALEEEGIKPFSRYPIGNEDKVCAKLLALDGVEFCSVQKQGHRVVVKMQTSPFPVRKTDKNAMVACRSGEIVSMTVLRGSPLKRIGDKIQAGETLVEPYFYTEGGGQVRVEIIARVRIACTWEADVEAESEEEAFAKAYLALEITDAERIKKTEIINNGTLHRVKIEYDAVETLNF